MSRLLRVLVLLLPGVAGAGACHPSPRSVAPAPAAAEARSPREGEPQEVVVEGAQGGFEEPFVAVVRDLETWTRLRGDAPAPLPELDAGLFRARVLIAVFLGTRPTPGYKVEIARTARGFRVVEHGPPPDAILPQVLTSPFQVVSASVGGDEGVILEMGGPLRATMWPVRVTGTFETTGGIAGRRASFPAAGELLVGRHGGLVTVIFDLASAGTGETRRLEDTVTGVVDGEGRLTLPRFHAGSFLDPPCRTLRASGGFGAGGGTISLAVESVPCGIPDSFEGRGRLDAATREP